MDDDEVAEDETVFVYMAGLRRILKWVREAQKVDGVTEMTAQQYNDLDGLEEDAYS